MRPAPPRHVARTSTREPVHTSSLNTALLGAGLGIPAFRVYGVGASDNPIYFLLATLAFGELLVRVAISARTLTGGSTGMAGIPYPDLGIGLEMTPGRYYYLVFARAMAAYGSPTIAAINTDGTGLEQVTTESIFNAFAMFSPDGTKLDFASNRFQKAAGETNVYIADWKR